MAIESGFTEAVRQELGRRPMGPVEVDRAELAGILRLGGTVTVHGGVEEAARVTLEVRTPSGAVARRVFALLQHGHGVRGELRVLAPEGVRRRSTYAVRVAERAPEVGRDLGLLDEGGRPVDGLPGPLDGRTAVAYLRGAFLAAGSLSAPGRPAHLELSVRSPTLAETLTELTRRVVDGTVTAATGQRPRVVVKSGETIADLLTALGATGALAAWDDRRERRRLRGEATRLANADAANLQRTIEAATTQVRTVESVIAVHGWQALDDDLRAVALARLANPAATLAELGELVEPPIAKSAVHRRLRRLERLAAEQPDG